MTDIQQVVRPARSAGRGFRAYSAKHLDMLAQRAGLAPDERLAVRAVATVLPFRTNSYVVENLIDWDAAPDDPTTGSSSPSRTCCPPPTCGGSRT